MDILQSVNIFTKEQISGNFSLKKKLILSFLSILIVVMAISTFYYLSTSTSRIKTDLQDKLSINSIAANIILDSDIKETGSLCTNIANDNALKMPLQFNLSSQISDYCNWLMNKNESIDEFILASKTGNVLFSSSDKLISNITSFIKKSEQFSGLFLYQNLYIISVNAIKDTNNAIIGYVAIAHNIETDSGILTGISSKIGTTALLYKGNELVAMSDADKKLYDIKKAKNSSIASEKIYKSKDGIYASGNTKKLFNNNLYINYRTLSDIDGKPVGILAVAQSNTILINNTVKVVINMLLISFLSLGAAFALIFFIADRLTKPINELVILMKEVENGDLTVKSKTVRHDEIGSLIGSFNIMVEELNRMVKTIVLKSEDIAGSSVILSNVYNDIQNGVQSITASIKEVAEGSESNSASIEEISAGLQEVASETSDIATKCSKSIDLSCLAVNNANTGISFISDVKNSVNIVVNESNNALGKILELEQYSKKISGVVKTIVKVADAINLLGLNAAIEAARAGSFGLGFRVVAEEINKLAVETKSKVQEVTQLNTEIIKRVKDSVEGIKTSTNDADNSFKLFIELENIIKNITTSINSVDSNMRTVNDAVVTQASTTEEIASTMDNITGITMATSDASIKIYDAAKKVSDNMGSTMKQIKVLEETSNNLKGLAKRFKIEQEAVREVAWDESLEAPREDNVVFMNF